MIKLRNTRRPQSSICVAVPYLQNKVGKIYLYIKGVFNKTIIPLVLVGYEMILASSILVYFSSFFFITFELLRWVNYIFPPLGLM